MSSIKKLPISLVEKVHRFTQDNTKEVSQLFTPGDMVTNIMKKAIDNVTSSSIAGVGTGKPHIQRNSPSDTWKRS